MGHDGIGIHCIQDTLSIENLSYQEGFERGRRARIRHIEIWREIYSVIENKKINNYETKKKNSKNS